MPFDAALAESAGHEDAVVVFQFPFQSALFEALGFDPVDLDLDVVGDAAVQQRFFQALVGILVLDVLADQRDVHLVARILHAVEHGGPVFEIARAGRHRDADGAG